jgi:hypothetical protein
VIQIAPASGRRSFERFWRAHRHQRDRLALSVEIRCERALNGGT